MQSSGSGARPGRFRVGEWSVDPDACRLVAHGKEIHLRPLLMDLLVLLATRPGTVVTKDEIIDTVWQGRFLSDSVLTRTVTELRSALDDDVRQPRIIETIRKRGYRLIADVVGLGHAPVPRLAVLPFENLNHDPEYDYFAAGISDALTTELGNITGLQVISRQSVLAAAGVEKSLAEIARPLGVDAIVEGSALHAGDRVRVNAQLIRVDPEHHLWAESYAADMSDILELQGSVARSVAEAVEARLTPKEVARLTRPRPVRPEAHVAYLKARYQALRWDQDGLEKGFHHLQEALRIDPDYAPAHSLLALAFVVLGYWGHLPVEAAYPRAKEAAETAIGLDVALGEAHTVLGIVRWLMDWDLDGCEAEMRTGLELSPSSELAHAFYALFLAIAREDRELAETHTRLALTFDPLSMSTGFVTAWLHFFAEEHGAAIAQAESTLERFPGCLHAHYVLGWAALAEHRHSDAVAAFTQAAALSRDAISVGYLAVGYGRAGNTAEAGALLRELTAMRTDCDVPEFLFTLVHSALGDQGAALASLERCHAAHDSRVFWFKVPAIGGDLLPLPEFQELMGRVEACLRSPGGSRSGRQDTTS